MKWQPAPPAVDLISHTSRLLLSGISQYPYNEDVTALRYENDAMRAQIADLSVQNSVLSSQMQDMALKMSALFARLDALPSS